MKKPRPDVRPAGGRARDGGPTKLNAELSDQVWNAMIIIALKYQRRIGRFHDQRSDRKCVLFVLIVIEVMVIFLDKGVIHPWQGGFRRLDRIQETATRDFRRLHGKCYFDI